MSAPTIKLIPESYPGAELVFTLGSLVPTPAPNSGIAQYSTVERPRRRDGMEFKSEKPVVDTFSIIMDQWAQDGNVIEPYNRVWGWAAKNNLASMPTVIRTEGPIPFSYLRWVITNIEQIEVRQRQSDWALSYFELKIELTEWNDLDLIVQGNPVPQPPPSPAKTAAQRFQDTYGIPVISNPKIAAAFGVKVSTTPPTQARTYTVKQGDTLSAIAARELKNLNRWKDIAALNGLRDPNKIVPGQVLRLPS